MLSNKWTFSFVSNNVCLVSLSLVYIVVAIFYSSSDHDTYLEPLVPSGAELTTPATTCTRTWRLS